MPWFTTLPRPVAKRQPAPEDVARLLALADAAAPGLAEAFVRALTWETLPDDVRQALLAGNAPLAASQLTLAIEGALGATYLPVWQEAARQLAEAVAAQTWEQARAMFASLEVPSPLPTALPGDLIAPRAIEALRTEGLRRVQGLTSTTMEALRSPLMEGVAQGIPTPRIARELVPRLGLTSQQARTLETYAAGVQELPLARRQALVERRAMQLRRRRAMTIATNETLTALSSAHQAFWEAAAGQAGVTGQLRRFWTTARDERTCQVCAPVPSLNPEGVAMTEPFRTPAGPLLTPPAHILCRCVVVYRPAILAA